MNKFNIEENVMVTKDVEVSPLNFVRQGLVGTIIDETVPNYYLIKTERNGCYWIDGEYLIKLKEI